MVRAAPSGLRFWLTVDDRTNDSSSVCGVCETRNMSTGCEPLYPKCYCLSSNKSMNMMPSSPIHRRQHHFVDCEGTCMTQMTKDFVMHHDENYVKLNSISIKSHQFVTNCPYQTLYSKHNICSYEFLLRFHDSFASGLCNQIRTNWLWKIDTEFIPSLILHNTTEIIIIIKWNVLLVEKIFLVTSSMGQESSIDIDRWYVNNSENAMSSTDIFISNWFDVC